MTVGAWFAETMNTTIVGLLLLAQGLLLLDAASAEVSKPCAVSVVVEGDGKAPLPDVEVDLRSRPAGELAFKTGRDQKNIAKALTDGKGSAMWKDLPLGPDYYVVARFPGHSFNFATVKCEEIAGQPTVIAIGKPLDVSLLQLIANPSAWHDRRVRVIGYLNVEFEGNALYVHESDWTHGVSKNALWVDVSFGDMAKYKSLHHRYVIMEGMFDATSYGHLGMFSGELTNITRCDKWR